MSPPFQALLTVGSETIKPISEAMTARFTVKCCLQGEGLKLDGWEIVGGQVFSFAHLVQNPFRAVPLHKVGGALLLASDSLNLPSMPKSNTASTFVHFPGILMEPLEYAVTHS